MDGDGLAGSKTDSTNNTASDDLHPFEADYTRIHRDGTWNDTERHYSFTKVIRHKAIFFFMNGSEASNISYGWKNRTGTPGAANNANAKAVAKGVTLTFVRLAIPDQIGTDQTIKTSSNSSGLGVLSGTSGSYTALRPFNTTGNYSGSGPYFLDYT